MSYLARCQRGYEGTGPDVQGAIQALTSKRIYAQRPFDDGDGISIFCNDPKNPKYHNGDFDFEDAIMVAVVNVIFSFQKAQMLEDGEMGEGTGEVVYEW